MFTISLISLRTHQHLIKSLQDSPALILEYPLLSSIDIFTISTILFSSLLVKVDHEKKLMQNFSFEWLCKIPKIIHKKNFKNKEKAMEYRGTILYNSGGWLEYLRVAFDSILSKFGSVLWF